MNWELRLRKRAKKNILRFPRRDQLHVTIALREISSNPYTGDIVKLEGEKNSWRRRVGAYRIFYELNSQEKVISIFRVERRGSKTY